MDVAPWFEALTAPASVALVGASNDPTGVSGRIQHFLGRWGYAGAVHPVNPRRAVVQGVPAGASVDDLPLDIDVAIVVLPAAAVPDAVEGCVRRRVKVVVIGAAGFGELGAEGARAEAALRAAVAGSPTRLIGPNGNGVVAARSRFTGSFMSGLETDRFELVDGGVTLVSQSGAIGGFVLNVAQSTGLGLGTFVSTGNEVDLGFEDCLAELAADPGTRIVAGYIEGLHDGTAFVEAARQVVAAGKPVVVLKVGRSALGSSAAVSHTGALAGVDRVYDGVFRQLGITRVDSLDQLVDVARVLSFCGGRLGRRLSVLTISGGAGIMATDRASERGLDVPVWEQTWREKVGAVLPSFAATGNPIDSSAILADPMMLEQALRVVDEHPDTDVTVLLTGNAEQTEAETASLLADVAAELTKPLVVAWVGGAGVARQILNQRGVACFDDPIRCIDAVALATEGMEATRRPVGGRRAPIRPDDVTAPPSGSVLDEVAAKRLLAAYGLPVAREVVAVCPAAAASAVAEVGLPAVVKLRAEGLAHKADLGAVLLGRATTDDVAAGIDQLLRLADANGLGPADVVVAEQVDVAYELIVGATVDPTFGPVLTVGLGGVLTELLEDVAVLLPDFTVDELVGAIARLRGARLLTGFRGLPTVDAAALEPVLRAVAAAVSDPRLGVASIDVNPVAVDWGGALIALDALVQIR